MWAAVVEEPGMGPRPRTAAGQRWRWAGQLLVFRSWAPARPFPGQAASLLPGSPAITRTGACTGSDDEPLIRS